MRLPLRRPHWGPGQQPRHVSWRGIERVTLWFAACTQSTEPQQPGQTFLFNLKRAPVCEGLYADTFEVFDEHLGCFLLLTFINAAAANICVQVFLWISILISLWDTYVYRYGIVSSNCAFNLRRIGSLIYKMAAPVYMPSSSIRGFQYFPSLTNMLFSGFLILAILVGVKFYHIKITTTRRTAITQNCQILSGSLTTAELKKPHPSRLAAGMQA